MGILGSVGVGGKNQYGDVKQVQQLLQRNGFPQIRDDGRIGPKTIQAIKDYQSRFMRPDGVVDVHGKTYTHLVRGTAPGRAPAPSSAPPPDNRHMNSGRLTVSSGQVTFNAEGNDIPTSLFFSRHIHWPKGVSGVTIGRGYDMGHRSADKIISDLVLAGVPQAQALSMSRGKGLTGESAGRFVTQYKNECGVISREAQARLFELIYPGYVAAAKDVYLNKTSQFPERTSWEALNPVIRDIVVDFVYQGLGFERVMKQCMYNDFDVLIKYIEDNAQIKQYEGGRQRANYLRSKR